MAKKKKPLTRAQKLASWHQPHDYTRVKVTKKKKR